MLLEINDFSCGVNMEIKCLQLMADRSPIQVDPIKMVLIRSFSLEMVTLNPSIWENNTGINCSSGCSVTFFIM